MENINVNQFRANEFVKESLMLIGFPEIEEIQSFILDDGTVGYHAVYHKDYKGEMVKHIKPLTQRDFIDLMKFAMEVNGYDIRYIKVKPRESGITYTVTTEIVSYGEMRKNKKRR